MKMIFHILVLVLMIAMKSMAKADHNNPVIYLLPGQGSDARLFSNLELDSTFDIRHIRYHNPEKGMSMHDYARSLAVQIDTGKPFVLIGVSLGGMLAVEMSTFLSPMKVIVISSAKNRYELPGRYRFQSSIPVYKILSDNMAKTGAQFMQPIVEPDRNNEKEICKQMLADKDPVFLNRTIGMIINWEREKTPDAEIIHIHGDHDHTIPIRNVRDDYKIEGGSHMMVLTRGPEVSKLIRHVLDAEH